MKKYSDLFKVLSDETRLRIVNLLFRQKLCVCELTEILDESQPKISKHIAKIRSIDLVETERNTQYIYYSLNGNYSEILKSILKHANEFETLRSDLEKLSKIETFVCAR